MQPFHLKRAVAMKWRLGNNSNSALPSVEEVVADEARRSGYPNQTADSHLVCYMPLVNIITHLLICFIVSIYGLMFCVLNVDVDMYIIKLVLDVSNLKITQASKLVTSGIQTVSLTD
jgi:hypothetical protein